jgi:hypothetical protein
MGSILFNNIRASAGQCLEREIQAHNMTFGSKNHPDWQN